MCFGRSTGRGPLSADGAGIWNPCLRSHRVSSARGSSPTATADRSSHVASRSSSPVAAPTRETAREESTRISGNSGVAPCGHRAASWRLASIVQAVPQSSDRVRRLSQNSIKAGSSVLSRTALAVPAYTTITAPGRRGCAPATAVGTCRINSPHTPKAMSSRHARSGWALRSAVSILEIRDLLAATRQPSSLCDHPHATRNSRTVAPNRCQGDLAGSSRRICAAIDPPPCRLR